MKNNSESEELSRNVSELFSQNKISNGINNLSEYWPLPKNELDALEEKTIKYLNLIESRFGKSIGYLKVNEEKIADIAIRETYLVRYSMSAIRLKFTYYKSTKGWILNAFEWDDSFTEEFKNN
ncbi:hypothetical protein [Flavobacterium okayamense]|uniref:hypothetical protein n=1 Tax=Flavobacterium okayamense TaxID=2830782 RepID=UPI002102BA57|nr:hypothetical protein [Flavobacterium okayamense]